MLARMALLAVVILMTATQLTSVRLDGQTPPPAPQMAKPVRQDELPQRKTPVTPQVSRAYVPAKAPWGDPDIAGAYTNSDESGIPFERPAEFANRTLSDVTPQELAEIVKRRQEQTIERAPTLSEFPGATSPLHWFENYN